jgi:Recombinase
LRHLRVASKQELKDRLMAAMNYFNQQPIVHTWSFKLDKAAWYDSNFGNADLVLSKFTELASARRLYLWLCQQQLQLPTAVRGAVSSRTISWSTPRYHSLLSLLKNPIYAGVYAYGRSRATVRLEQGRKRIVRRKHQREEWAVFLPNHHEGYISWAVYENNQALIANNANAKGDIVRGSIRRGSAMLSGILRCGHCGAKLLAQYPGPAVIRYQCGSNLRASARMPQAPGGSSIAAGDREPARCPRWTAPSQGAGTPASAVRGDACAAPVRWGRPLKPPGFRWAWASLEWSEEELAALRRQQRDPLNDATREELLALGHDVRRLWDHPKSPPEFKKRILRTVLKEIIASSDGDTVRLVLHWQGGDHTELTLQKTRTGYHRYITDTHTIDLIRSLHPARFNDRLDSQSHGSSYRARPKLEFQACVHNA